MGNGSSCDRKIIKNNFQKIIHVMTHDTGVTRKYGAYNLLRRFFLKTTCNNALKWRNNDSEIGYCRKITRAYGLSYFFSTETISKRGGGFKKIHQSSNICS
jgi:hypothetical protein